jgi:hypothetical protein
VSPYAERTDVSPEKSRMEIEQTLTRYGADRFAYMTEPGRAVVMFDLERRRVRFDIAIPPASAFSHFPKRKGEYGPRERTEKQKQDAWAQEVRRRWRALALCIKAKLEAVESGIESLDEAFLAHMVLPDGRRFAQWAAPQLEAIYDRGTMPALLPAADAAEIIDADAV